MNTILNIALFVLSLPAVADSGAATYSKDCFMTPCEIRGDFDGDGKVDRAILVKAKNGKKGIKVEFADAKIAVKVDLCDDYSRCSWALHKGKLERGDNE